MDYFCKYNGLSNDSLLKEIKSLELLKKTLLASNISEISIPKIFTYDHNEIFMQRIFPKDATDKQMETFGKALAQFHKIKQEKYGFDVDNFIGLSPQKNILSSNWGEFFYEYRLSFQANMIENPKIKEEFVSTLLKNKDKLINFLNENVEHPSLVHGDLWSGNVLFEKEKIYIIDPASYYADREVDVAMTNLFGGFSKKFYEAYNKEYPLSTEYKKKQVIYNLYHYLNHYNLFGISYLNSSKVSLTFINNF